MILLLAKMTSFLDYNVISKWEYCPLDIMMLIFKKLSLLDIHHCLQVNKIWREAATYFCDHNNLWKSLVKLTIFDRGNTVKEHTYCGGNDKEVYLNSILWKDIHLAECEITYLNLFQYAKHIHLHNDCLIIVFHHGVTFYDIGKCCTIDKILNDYDDFHFKGQLVCSINKLELYILRMKSNCNCKDQEIMNILLNPTLWCMDKKSCYFLDNKHCIWRYVVDDCVNHLHFIAKYYGNVRNKERLYVEDDKLYLIHYNGLVFVYSEISPRVYKLSSRGHVKTSLYSELYWFDTQISVYGSSKMPDSGPTRETFRGQGMNLSIHFHNLSAAVRHGNLILLGYNDGLLEVYEAVELITRSTKPMRQFQLLQDTPTPIHEIVVYEGNSTHTIFVLAGDHIAKVYLTHS